MSKDWNLKGKEKKITFLDKGAILEKDVLQSRCEKCGEFRLEVPQKYYHDRYFVETKYIETLRKKLITDIQLELYAENHMELLHNIVKTINKRFGVE